MRFLSKLTLNQRLGALGLALGALAVFANVAPGHTVTLNAKELLTSVERQEDHVTPAELAAWIIEGRNDYRLVDVRNEKASPSTTSRPRRTSPSHRHRRHARPDRQDRPLRRRWDPRRAGVDGPEGPRLPARLHPARGPRRLKDDVLFPVVPQSPTAEQQAQFERAAQVAKFFGGQPRAAAAPGSEPMALPTQALARRSRLRRCPPALAPARRRSARAAEPARLRAAADPAVG